MAVGISALISLLECPYGKLTQRANIAGIREVMLCDRIDSFRSASHSFPKKMAKESVKLIFFERENYGGNYVIWPWQFKCFFFGYQLFKC